MANVTADITSVVPYNGGDAVVAYFQANGPDNLFGNDHASLLTRHSYGSSTDDSQTLQDGSTILINLDYFISTPVQTQT